MDTVLHRFLASFVREGRLDRAPTPMARPATMGTGAGRRRRHGRLRIPACPAASDRRPNWRVGEGYMDGQPYHRRRRSGWVLAPCHAQSPPRGLPLTTVAGCAALSRGAVDAVQPVGRSRKNVAHHYDLYGELYDLFLDEDRQYSCAYFARCRDDAGRGAGGQEAAYRRQAAAQAGDARAGYRLRLGRHGADAGTGLRRRGVGRHAVRGAAQLCAQRRASDDGLSDTRGYPS